MYGSGFRKWMGVAALFAATTCVAQDASTTRAYKAACGAVDTKLDATLAKPSGPLAPDAGKALVYLIQRDDQTNSFCFTQKCGGADVRVGLDGTWVGETMGGSFVALQVDPGDHHLCTNWQSHFKKVSHHEVSLQPLTAEAGKTYYFRIRVSRGGGTEAQVPFSLSLEPLNVDEANMLLELSPQSTLKK